MNLEQIKATLLERYPNGDKTALEEYMKIIATPDTDEYTEKHHILPKHDEAWPEYKDFEKEFTWNMVRLNGGNHFLAHLWLARFTDNGSDWNAADRMSKKGPNKARLISINELPNVATLIKEAREKSAAAKRGVQLSDETRAKMSATKRGVPKSPEHRASMIVAQNKPEVKAKKSAAKTGVPLSPEHCASISYGKKGVLLSDETRAKMSIAKKGVQRSDEARTAVSIGARIVTRTSPVWQMPLYGILWNEWSSITNKKGQHLKRGNFAKHLRSTGIIPLCSDNTVGSIIRHFNCVLSSEEELWHPIEPLQLAA